jgi:uncharacterized protein YjbI with pentapeptide repeats
MVRRVTRPEYPGNMANGEHLAVIKQGTDTWNDWRIQNRSVSPDLGGVNLIGMDLSGADLTGANLHLTDLRWMNLRWADLGRAYLRGANLSGAWLDGANLSGADLRATNLTAADSSWANLSGADLTGANLDRANLKGADLTGVFLVEANLSGTNCSGADLTRADLTEALLGGTNLTGANLDRADLTKAGLFETIFADMDLTTAIGLHDCRPIGPSVIDFHTLTKSRNLPLSFLRGCGLPDTLIEYLPSLRGDAIRHYSCFISYSAKDQLFADKLYADLQNKSVRCWFAPHDLPIGAKIWDAIDEAIRLRDKLLIILSDAAIASDWVEDEVSKAFAEERERNATILLPIRIDDAVMTTSEPWARKLHDQRHIGDFRSWKENTQYQEALERLLRELKC